MLKNSKTWCLTAVFIFLSSIYGSAVQEKSSGPSENTPSRVKLDVSNLPPTVILSLDGSGHGTFDVIGGNKEVKFRWDAEKPEGLSIARLTNGTPVLHQKECTLPQEGEVLLVASQVKESADIHLTFTLNNQQVRVWLQRPTTAEPAAKSPSKQSPDPSLVTSASNIQLYKRIVIGLVALIAIAILGLAIERYLRSRKEKAQTSEQVLPETLEEGIRRLTNEFSRINSDLGGLKAALQGLSEGQSSLKQDINQIKHEVENLSGGMEGAVRQLLSIELPAVLRAIDTRINALEQLPEIVTRHEEYQKYLQSRSERGLESILRVLPEQVLMGVGASTADGRELQAAKLDEAVSQFFRASVPARDGLSQYSKRCINLINALVALRDSIDRTNTEAEARLAGLLQEARRLNDALSGLLPDAEANRIRLNFSIEFETGTSGTQSLIEGIATGIRNEMVKLGNAPQYFERQLAQVATTSAAVASDFLDSKLDPGRKDEDLQRLLKMLFQAAEVDEIAPKRNDDFRAIEHSVLQIAPRTTSSDRSQAVAQLVTRGFKYRDRVIRKASVLVFQ